MATQYTAGLTTGQVLTAATMNSIGAEWETYTPTVTGTAGAIGSGALITARYSIIQKVVQVQFEYDINTAGAAAGGSLNVTLPFAPKTTTVGGNVGFGREYRVVGFNLQALFIGGTTARISKYDGGNWVTTGYGCSVTFCYEAV